MTASTRSQLRTALHGVRALVLDADGVLVMRGAALPGAREALARLDERGIPYRVATNISAVHRETLAARFERIGLPIPPERIVTALSATAEDARRTYPGRPLFVITRPDGLREFGDHPLLAHEDADADDARAAAVIFGDGDEDLSYANLDRAFRLVRRGAELVAMHRNGWWYTAKGETIDTGAFVAAVEYATGRPGPRHGQAGAAHVPHRVPRPGRRRRRGRRPAPAPRRGRHGRATTLRRTSAGPTVPACAGSSSCPGAPPPRRCPISAGRPSPMRSPRPWARSSPR